MIGHETYHLLCLEISNHYSRSTFNRHLVYGCFDAHYFKAFLHPMPALSFVCMECKVGHDCIQSPWMIDISSKKVAKYGLSSTQGLRLQETSVDLWATQEKLLLISLHNFDAKLTCRSQGKEKQAMPLLNNVKNNDTKTTKHWTHGYNLSANNLPKQEENLSTTPATINPWLQSVSS